MKFIKVTNGIKVICLLTIIALLTMCLIDYNQTINKMEKPIFASCYNGDEDGGSGNYIGLGYNIELKGELSAEYGYIVDEVEFYILGMKIAETNTKQ